MWPAKRKIFTLWLFRESLPIPAISCLKLEYNDQLQAALSHVSYQSAKLANDCRFSNRSGHRVPGWPASHLPSPCTFPRLQHPSPSHPRQQRLQGHVNTGLGLYLAQDWTCTEGCWGQGGDAWCPPGFHTVPRARSRGVRAVGWDGLWFNPPAAPPLMGWLRANALASVSLAAPSVKWAQGSPGLTGSCEDEGKRCLHSTRLDKCQGRGLCVPEAP